MNLEMLWAIDLALVILGVGFHLRGRRILHEEGAALRFLINEAFVVLATASLLVIPLVSGLWVWVAFIVLMTLFRAWYALRMYRIAKGKGGVFAIQLPL